jgi:hypothetical protein
VCRNRVLGTSQPHLLRMSASTTAMARLGKPGGSTAHRGCLSDRIELIARLASHRDIEDEKVSLDRVLPTIDSAKRLKLGRIASII